MLINEIGVLDDVVELDDRRPTTSALDPKARETLSDILASSLRAFDTPPAPRPRSESAVSPLSAPETPSASRAGSAA